MWIRIAATYSVWFEPEPLACYRMHPGNETTRLRHADRDLDDVCKAVRMIRSTLPLENRDSAGSSLLAHFRQIELDLTCAAFERGKLRSGLASIRRAMKCDRSLRFSRIGFNYYKWALKIWLSKMRHQPVPGALIRPQSPPGPDD